MNKLENIEENVELNTNSVTLDIPLRVVMTSYGDAPFEFTTSIDEVGQIILTPTTKEVEFIDANTSYNVDYDTPISEQETVLKVDGDITQKETSISIQADMIVESNNLGVSAVVDEIGQVVIYPFGKGNIFVSAVINNSLNLVTEETETESPSQDSSTEDESDNSVDEHEVKVDLNDISAEVIEEAVSDEIVKGNAPEDLASMTDNFEEQGGLLKCDTPEEQEECVNMLNEHYETVIPYLEESVSKILYKTPKKHINENVEEDSRTTIIDRFMRGEIPLFSDSGIPSPSYKHMSELDSNGYKYYYDEESDAIISYPELM